MRSLMTVFSGLHPNIWLLMGAQALFGSLSPIIIFVGGFIGLSLAPSQVLATLPVACMIVGTAVFMVPVVKVLSLLGRKNGFLLAATWGVANALLTAYSVMVGQFWLFCFSTLLFGVVVASAQQFRFAAMESVDAHQAGQAVSVLMMAGLIAAFLGPEVAFIGKDMFSTPFVGSFVGLILLFILSMGCLSFYRPLAKPIVEENHVGRPLGEIVKQPVFIAAIASAAAGFSVMSFIMTATPISMHVHSGFDMADTKWVIQSHIIAMFLPSFFTGKFITKWGHATVLYAGIVIMLVCIAVGFIGHHYVHYWWALVLLGVGWNCMFVTATALLPKSYTAHEKFKVQGFNDLIIFTCQALASLSAGWVIKTFGWEWLLSVCIPVLLLTGVCVRYWQHTTQVTYNAQTANAQQ